MTNPARKQTDKLLDELEKKFEKEYEEAYASIKKEADAYFARFSKEDAIKKQMLQDGTLSKQQYTEWRAREMMTGTRYREMVDTLAKEMVKSDQLAMKALDTTMKDTLAINANYATYEVEKATGISTGWSLYNRDAVGKLIKDEPDLLPKPKVKIADDLKWNRQHISSALAQGILQGESIDKITDRLMSVTDMDARTAIRNARTMVTSAENAGKEITYSRAEELGIKGKKMWMATKDKRTRESHALLDGETVDLDEPFSNGLMYPGDPDGDPEEVYNCRCTMVYVSEHSAFRDDYETYEEWLGEKLERKEKKEETVPGKTVAEILSKTGEGYSDGQKSALANCVRNAPQDTQDFYQKYIGSCEPVVQDSSRGFYRPWDNSTHFSISRAAAGDSLNAPYQLHFHEYGHNLDYQAAMAGQSIRLPQALSEMYRDDKGRTFGDIITDEWDKRFANQFLADNPRHKGRITYKDKLPYFREFVKDVKSNYSMQERGDLSDMVERYSCRVGFGAYPLGAGHGREYALEAGRLEKETFAEMFSAEMANSGSLDLIKKYLPESYDAFHDILRKAASK